MKVCFESLFSCFHLPSFPLKRNSKPMFVFGINIYFCFYFYCSLESSGYYGSTSNAFIFSLRNKEGLEPFKSMVRKPSYAIEWTSVYGPTFGGGLDIHIASNANINQDSYTRFGHSYSVPSGVRGSDTILAGTEYFTPDDWEVFYLA